MIHQVFSVNRNLTDDEMLIVNMPVCETISCNMHTCRTKTMIALWCTESHFSYAPLFQGPQFLTKMLESTILFDNYLLTFYLFDDIKKYQNH